eukprot:scaffold45148_cov23-Tisochrysis_lutea.AAC.2
MKKDLDIRVEACGLSSRRGWCEGSEDPRQAAGAGGRRTRAFKSTSPTLSTCTPTPSRRSVRSAEPCGADEPPPHSSVDGKSGGSAGGQVAIQECSVDRCADLPAALVVFGVVAFLLVVASLGGTRGTRRLLPARRCKQRDQLGVHDEITRWGTHLYLHGYLARMRTCGKAMACAPVPPSVVALA